MTVFRLPEENIFPSPSLAEESGLLAVGGDLSESRLLNAYKKGIFPWYSDGDPILWWSPDPRLIMKPENFILSRSLKQTLKKNTFRITMDTAFREVIESCSEVHEKKAGDTWITRDMINAYIDLHDAGYAHSIEAWKENELAGGLYGVSLGSAFFGESMFTKTSNASKAAFAALVFQMSSWKFSFIDCQVTTKHLLSLGASEVPRDEFLNMLSHSLETPAKKCKWHFDESTLMNNL